MPTYGRARMVPVAVHTFLDQDYPGPATLYILDDSPVPWVPCCSSREGRDVIYLWDNLGKRNCAAKRNHIMRIAIRDHGDAQMFALWDDDDLYGPARLRHQVQALQGDPKAEVCILSRWILYDQERDLVVCATDIGADGTSVFRLAHWERSPWDESLDAYTGPAKLTEQMTVAPERIVRVAEPEDYVVVRHGTNATAAPSASYRGGAWKYPCPLSAAEVASRLRTAAACRAPRCR